MEKTHQDLDSYVIRLWKQGRIRGTKREVRDQLAEVFAASHEDPETAYAAIEAAVAKGARSILDYAEAICRNGNGNGHRERDIQRPPASPEIEETQAPSAESHFTDTQTSKANGNFVLVNRALRHHPFLAQCPHWVGRFWLNLILDAAYEDHDMAWLDGIVHLKRGQWVITERRIATEYKVAPRIVHYWLDKLELEGMIHCEPVYRPVGVEPKIYVASCVAGFVASSVAGGTLVTLCNYNKFQAEKKVNVARSVASDVASCVAISNNGFSKKGIQKKGDTTPTPSPLGVAPRTPLENQNSFSPEILLADYNENIIGGRLLLVPHLTSKTKEMASRWIAEVIVAEGSPERAREKWVETVKRATMTDASHGFINFKWLIKNDDNYMDILEGTKYAKPFRFNGRTPQDEAREKRRRGGVEGHTLADGEVQGGTPRLGIDIGEAPKMP